MKISLDGLHWRIGAAEERGAEKSVYEFEKDQWNLSSVKDAGEKSQNKLIEPQ